MQNGAGPWAWDGHWLMVPLHDTEGNVTGVIWADEPTDRLLPERPMLQTLRVFANQATAALDSAARFQEMRFLAEHDPLTRLLNRRAFNDRLEARDRATPRATAAASRWCCATSTSSRRSTTGTDTRPATPR